MIRAFWLSGFWFIWKRKQSVLSGSPYIWHSGLISLVLAFFLSLHLVVWGFWKCDASQTTIRLPRSCWDLNLIGEISPQFSVLFLFERKWNYWQNMWSLSTSRRKRRSKWYLMRRWEHSWHSVWDIKIFPPAIL